MSVSPGQREICRNNGVTVRRGSSSVFSLLHFSFSPSIELNKPIIILLFSFCQRQSTVFGHYVEVITSSVLLILCSLTRTLVDVCLVLEKTMLESVLVSGVDNEVACLLVWLSV